ncbi:transposase/IS protein [Maliponia aquimaris]|uniref:Transposase/IS protein n=1 Tax=Maliponia aquimaris TaxID=1673631 RepID=A0A238L744_9RHOB|nr:transposase/IS protein [Maliponia aquimaris]
MTIAKLPLAKEIKEFDFEAAEVNETLIRDPATGDFLDHQRNLVLIGGTGTGKTHLAVSIARACIRNGRRGRFFNVVDLVNKLDAEGVSVLDEDMLVERILFASGGHIGTSIVIAKAIVRDAVKKQRDAVSLERAEKVYRRLKKAKLETPFKQDEWALVQKELIASGWAA